MTKEEATVLVDAKVKAAVTLLKEAEKVAGENDIPFCYGLISQDDDGYATTEFGWTPSSMNC